MGSHVKIGSFEAMANQLISGLANCAYGRPAPSRQLGESTDVGAVGGVLPCADGYVAVSPREDAQWERWLHVMGDPEWAADERFAILFESSDEYLGGSHCSRKPPHPMASRASP